MSKNHWKTCLAHLERELPADDFNTWVRPLRGLTGAASAVFASQAKTFPRLHRHGYLIASVGVRPPAS